VLGTARHRAPLESTFTSLVQRISCKSAARNAETFARGIVKPRSGKFFTRQSRLARDMPGARPSDWTPDPRRSPFLTPCFSPLKTRALHALPSRAPVPRILSADRDIANDPQCRASIAFQPFAFGRAAPRRFRPATKIHGHRASSSLPVSVDDHSFAARCAGPGKIDAEHGACVPSGPTAKRARKFFLANRTSRWPTLSAALAQLDPHVSTSTEEAAAADNCVFDRQARQLCGGPGEAAPRPGTRCFETRS